MPKKDLPSLWEEKTSGWFSTINYMTSTLRGNHWVKRKGYYLSNLKVTGFIESKSFCEHKYGKDIYWMYFQQYHPNVKYSYNSNIVSPLAHLFNGPLPTAKNRCCKNKFSLLMNLTNYYYSLFWLDSLRALERCIIIVTNLMLSIFWIEAKPIEFAENVPEAKK